MRFELFTIDDTEQAARTIAAVLREGDVISLEGEMGAGKTTFVKGLLAGLKSAAEVTSPTFAIAQYYEAVPPVWHLDLYRIDDPEELEDIGYEEYFYPEDAVTLIEWPQMAGDYLPEGHLTIRIEKEGDRRRLILDEPLAERLEARV